MNREEIQYIKELAFAPQGVADRDWETYLVSFFMFK
jgi:hypothetical protein